MRGGEAVSLAVAVHAPDLARSAVHLAALHRAGLEPRQVADPLRFLAEGPGRVVLVALGSQAGAALLRAVASHDPPGVAVAVVPEATPDAVRLAHRCGAAAVVGMAEPPEEAAETVRSAAAGYVRLPRRVAAPLLADRAPCEASPPVLLGPEELGWLRALAQGATVAELARDGHRSLRTMERLLAGLFRRMGVAKEVQAVAAAYEWGLL